MVLGAHPQPLGKHHQIALCDLKPSSMKVHNGVNPQADLKQQTTPEGRRMSPFSSDIGSFTLLSKLTSDLH